MPVVKNYLSKTSLRVCHTVMCSAYKPQVSTFPGKHLYIIVAHNKQHKQK